MLDYDRTSDVRVAVGEAKAPRGDGDGDADRRRAQRIREPLHAELSPWEDNRAGTAFGVVIDDFSTTGVGLRHTARLKLGARYLLEIPRPHQRPLSTVLTVVRCDQSVGGWFEVEMTPDELLDVAVTARAHRARTEPPRHRSLRTALVLVALAAAAAAVLINLL